MNKKEVRIEANDTVQDLGNNMVKVNNKTYNTKYYKVIGMEKAKQPKSATPKKFEVFTDKQQEKLSFNARSNALKFCKTLGKENKEALMKFFIEVMGEVYKE